MKDQKLFYIFKDPIGAPDTKIGITGHPEVRLGTYQNGYSKNSHTACFDRVYIGPVLAVNNLEIAIKKTFNWEIDRDGRGCSEWISLPYTTVEDKVDEIIQADKFKVVKIPKEFLPLTVDNLPNFRKHYNLDNP